MHVTDLIVFSFLSALTFVNTAINNNQQLDLERYLQLFDDPNPVVRERSLYAFAKEWPNVEWDLFNRYSSDEDFKSEGSAEQDLRIILDTGFGIIDKISCEVANKAAKAAIKVLQYDKNVNVKVAAARMFRMLDLHKVGRDDIRRALGIEIQDPSWRLRLEALYTAEELSYITGEDPTIVRRIRIRSILDHNCYVRSEGIIRLFQYEGNPDVVMSLERALKDDELEVRINAAYTLAFVGECKGDIFKIAVESMGNPLYIEKAIACMKLIGPIGVEGQEALTRAINSEYKQKGTRAIIEKYERGEDIMNELRCQVPDSRLLIQLENAKANWVEKTYNSALDMYVFELHWDNGWEERGPKWRYDDDILEIARGVLNAIGM